MNLKIDDDNSVPLKTFIIVIIWRYSQTKSNVLIAKMFQFFWETL